MGTSGLRSASAAAVLLSAALASAGACNLNFSNQAEAHDEWTRSYSLAQGGTLEIRNTNGRIDVQSGDGNAVQVTVVRRVRASSDEAARDGLSKFDIAETATPSRVKIDSSNRSAGFLLGLSREADYDIRVPRWANVTLNQTTGKITIAGVTGAVQIQVTNAEIHASGLEGDTRVESTNGAISLDVNKVGPNGITGETTNGMITLILPSDAKAQVSARVTNGAITTEGLTLSTSEQSRRRLDGTIGGGGPSIRLETTNGAIRLKGK